ncbi:hypothetical protein J4N45_23130 [Vibrio sp. SCSIO 43140]|uniref:GDSL-type esterase/lipase family protein n=1 Tax=Vibrio sp. SCSIO 43140 TaxID=2819100 RepID=UPI002076665A|nr:GDSL-type esterase/lipase family protein [Vibrio sp. SCSIO 43140]USD62272.1 hypothetical protein J4N45_23130 [Vibrio sp. SCSIO 43140]
MLIKKTFQILMLSLFIVLSFVYGLAVGTYKIFPYNEVQNVKRALIGGDGKGHRSFKEPSYTHKTSFFKLIAQNDYDIVFIGDSITDGSDWNDVFPDKIIANRGISGDTTDGVLKRMDTILNTKAEKAFVMIGTNDVSRGFDVETIFKNYVEILDLLLSNDIEPIVQSTLFTYNDEMRDNRTIKALNKKLKTFCENNDITYVDLNAILSKNETLIKKYSDDGLHLNGSGYVAWSKIIEEHVY